MRGGYYESGGRDEQGYGLLSLAYFPVGLLVKSYPMAHASSQEMQEESQGRTATGLNNFKEKIPQ